MDGHRRHEQLPHHQQLKHAKDLSGLHQSPKKKNNRPVKLEELVRVSEEDH